MNERTYILSTGRTGTNFLAHYFDTHRDAVAVHEPRPSRLLRLVSNLRLAGKISRDLAQTIFQALDSLTRNHDVKYIESNPFIVGFADIVHLVHPGSKVLHIVRDPRTYIPSIMNHNNTSGLKSLGNKYLPFWLWRNSRTVAKPYRNQLFTRYAEYWTVANQFIFDHAYMPNYHLFRFEDVFKPPHRDLEKLEDFVGLDMSNASGEITIERPLNQSEDDALPAWADWADGQVMLVDELCGELMEQYGYGKEQAWLDRVSIARTTKATT